MVFHSGASWEKSPCIVFRICNHGNNSKKCAGRWGLGSDPTYWPTGPLCAVSPQSLKETMAVMVSFRSLISRHVTVLQHFCYIFLFLLLSCFSKVWSTSRVDSFGAFHAGVWSECCLLCKRHHVQHLAFLWGFLLGGPRSLPLRAQ